MVPGRVLPVDALPLTVNGKLDRKALTERAARDDTPVVAAGDAALDALVGIFAEVVARLRRRTATPTSSGPAGDSIVAITVVNRARALGLPIAPRDVFLLRTPRALAEHLGTRVPQAPATRPPCARTAR